MKIKIFTTMLLSSCVVVCVAATINDITGKWMTTLKPGDGSQISVTYIFKADGNKFTGTVEFPNNNFPITDGMVKGDSISFKVSLNGHDIPNYGKLYADSIGLDIAMNGKKYHNLLIRKN